MKNKNNLYYKEKKRLYSTCYLIRKIEEKISKIYHTDKIKSPVHLSIGQEMVSALVCNNLKNKDVVFSTYRGHATYIAKGGNLNEMISELYGKKSGCSEGKGGSMHLVDTKVNFMGTSALVASSIPEAVGYAFAQKYKKKNNVVVCFFGDGATNQGVFHESLNLASLYSLPILFVCENNDLAIHSFLSIRSAQKDLTKFASVNKIQTKSFYDYQYNTANKSLKKIINKIRNDIRPFFIEFKTYRQYSHVGPYTDWELGYRKHNNFNKDPLEKIKKELNSEDVKTINRKIDKKIIEVFNFAENDKFPSKIDLLKYNYE